MQLLQDIAGAATGFELHQTGDDGSIDAESGRITGQLVTMDETALARTPISISSDDHNPAASPANLFGSEPELQSDHMTKLLGNADFSRGLPRLLALGTESVHIPDETIPYSILQTEHCGMPSPPESFQETESRQKSLLNSVLKKGYKLEDILKAGLDALSGKTLDCDEKGADAASLLRTDKILLLHNSKLDSPSALPDPRRNNIRMKQFMFAAACLANASIIGLPPEATDCGYTQSPFFQNHISEENARTTCLNSFKNLKEHLRPVAAQVMYKHDPYIDTFPFPTFRERVIKLAYGDTPMIDEEDLCNDLNNDGLICWGSSLGGGSVATGSGAPWDIRSWEAQRWFLKKWWILVGGKDGELYKQTEWYCEMRGEKSCYPW